MARVGDGKCDVCVGVACSDFYDGFVAPSIKCCACGGGRYRNDYCVDSGWTRDMTGADQEWNDDGMLLGATAVVRVQATPWTCADYTDHGVCADGTVQNVVPYLARWEGHVLVVESGSLSANSGGELPTISTQAAENAMLARDHCCLCGGGDTDVCKMADANATTELLKQVDWLTSVVLAQDESLCPDNATLCKVADIDVKFHFYGMRLFYAMALAVAVVASFKLLFDAAWIFVRFKLRAVRGVQKPRCQTCHDTFSFDNLPNSCVQCGFYNCHACCSYRVLLPGLDTATDDSDEQKKRKHKKNHKNNTRACFNCSMLQRDDVLASLAATACGDPVTAIAKLILRQSERLPGVQGAYKREKERVEQYARDNSAVTPHSAVSPPKSTRPAPAWTNHVVDEEDDGGGGNDGTRLTLHPLRMERVLCKLRAKFGYFWHATVKVDVRHLVHAGTFRGGGGVEMQEAAREAKRIFTMGNDGRRSSGDDTGSGSGLRLVSMLRPHMKRRPAEVSLGDVVKRTLRLLEQQFKRTEAAATAHPGIDGNALAPIRGRLPLGLETGLMDGERSIKHTNQTFEFERRRQFQAPLLRVVFGPTWRQHVGALLGQTWRFQSRRRSINQSVRELHTLLHKKNVLQMVDAGQLGGGGGRRANAAAFPAIPAGQFAFPAQVDQVHCDRSKDVIPYCIQGVGVAESADDVAPPTGATTTRGRNGVGGDELVVIPSPSTSPLSVSSVLQAFWKLPQAQRDVFLTRIHDDTYFGLELDNEGAGGDDDDDDDDDGDDDFDAIGPGSSPGGAIDSAASSAASLLETMSQASLLGAQAATAGVVSKRICFQVPECAAFIPNVLMRIDEIFDFQKVNVAIFHDFLCVFAVDPMVDPFDDMTEGFVISQSTNAPSPNVAVARSGSFGSMKSVPEQPEEAELEHKRQASNSSSRGEDGLLLPKSESGGAAETAKLSDRDKIRLHVDNLLYYVTFEEIASCSNKPPRNGAEAPVARRDLDCLACLRRFTEPEYRRFKKSAAVAPVSSLSDLGSVKQRGMAGLVADAAAWFQVKSPNCHAVFALRLVTQRDVLQKLVADRVRSSIDLLAQHDHAASFPTRRSTLLGSLDENADDDNYDDDDSGSDGDEPAANDPRAAFRAQHGGSPNKPHHGHGHGHGRGHRHHHGHHDSHRGRHKKSHRHHHHRRRRRHHGDDSHPNHDPFGHRDSLSSDKPEPKEDEQCAAAFAHRVRLFTCGSEYFENVAHAMLQARSFILIRDWKLAPDVYLKRRSGVSGTRTNDEAYRLDNILLKKAREGVLVYVILYHELAIYTGSEMAQARLMSLHSNIVVLRHRSAQTDKMFWSHHEKFVNVDGCITFVGGLDLCHGRYDTPDHPLWDAEAPYVFPGCDYSNPQARHVASHRTVVSRRAASCVLQRNLCSCAHQQVHTGSTSIW